MRFADEIIFLILKRWIQENDFKYLIAHFGLDQITSYLFDSYRDIADTITDKNHISGKYKALTKELAKLRRKLKTALHKKHVFDSKFKIYQDISQLTNKQTDEIIKELSIELSKIEIEKPKKEPTQKQKEKQRKSYSKNLLKIVELSNKYHEKEQERKQTKRIVSKKEELAENGIQKLNTNPKQFMDVIKIIARNIFYLGFKPFKEKYNNYRDDHVIFRSVTQSNGIIRNGNSKMIINITPTMEISTKQRKIFSEIIDEINKQNLTLPNDLNQKFELEITENSNQIFAF